MEEIEIQGSLGNVEVGEDHINASSADRNILRREGGGIDDDRATVGVVESVNLNISRLSINTSCEVIDGEPVGSQETRQFGIDGAGNGVSGVEVENSRDETVGLGPRVNKETLENLSQVAVATVGTDRWKDVVGRDESLGLPGGNNTLLHGEIGNRDWFGLRSKGDLKFVDGEENSAKGV